MRWLQRKAGERGVAAVIVAICLVLLLSFSSLSLNVGHMMSIRTQLQLAADAAALAGSLDLDGTADAFPSVRNSASRYGGYHQSDIVPVEVDPDSDVVLGFWDKDVARYDKATAFTPYGGLITAARVNAVQVFTGREQTRGNAMPVFLGAILGRETSDIRASAVAVAGGPCESCVLPIAFAKCLVKPDPNGPLRCGAQLRFSNDFEDNIGFTSLDPDASVNTNDIIQILQGGCRQVDAEEPINVSNGDNLTPRMIDAFAPYIGTRVSAPIIDTGSDCSPRFNREYPVDGFAAFTIVQVLGPPQQSDREIIIQLDCEETESEAPGGCGFYGVDARPRLVR